MASASPTRVAKRRSQAQRTESTRNALLDAAIDCLAELGYSRITTRRVAARAGVTPGALLHHFPTKADLVRETLRRVLTRFALEMLAQAQAGSGSEPRSQEMLLDQMWELHKGPLFQASVELLVAARTDQDLRATVIGMREDRARLIAAAAPMLYPELSKRAGFFELLATGQAAMLGIALLAFASGGDADAEWRPAREHILELSSALLAGETDRP